MIFKRKTSGYLYIATGEKYILEAINSAKSLRIHDKNADITLITNKKIHCNIFNKILIRSKSDKRNFRKSKEEEVRMKGKLFKTDYILDTPYDNTIFLDSDTFICSDFREIFGLLDYFDICMTPAPFFSERNNLSGYYQFNSGVIVFKKNLKNKKLFNIWKEVYAKKDYEYDQEALADALLKSHSRIYPLNNFYNARTPFFISFPKGKVKIIHGREENYEEIEKELNKSLSNRSWDPVRKRINFRGENNRLN